MLFEPETAEPRRDVHARLPDAITADVIHLSANPYGERHLSAVCKPSRVGPSQRRLRGQQQPKSSGNRATAEVKGFGCRPVVTYPAVLRAGVGKPPRKEPAGAGGGSAVYGDLVGRRLA